MFTGTANDGEDTSPALSLKDEFRIDYIGVFKNTLADGDTEFLTTYMHLWQPTIGVQGLEKFKISIDVVRGFKSFRTSYLFDIEDIEVNEIIEKLDKELSILLAA